MTIPSARLLVMALSLATALPATAALAGWRDGPFYAEEGWGGEFEMPMRRHRPMPVYREDEGGYDQRSYYPRPWMRPPAYALDGEEPDFLPDERGPVMRAPRPPRSVVGVPQRPLRPVAPKPRSAALAAPKKIEPIKPLAPAAAPKPRPEPVQEALALPVPRPNLESMDFEPAK